MQNFLVKTITFPIKVILYKSRGELSLLMQYRTDTSGPKEDELGPGRDGPYIRSGGVCSKLLRLLNRLPLTQPLNSVKN